jgi:hypothetical protein
MGRPLGSMFSIFSLGPEGVTYSFETSEWGKERKGKERKLAGLEVMSPQTHGPIGIMGWPVKKWSDGFDANTSNKINRGSAWTHVDLICWICTEPQTHMLCVRATARGHI